MKKSLVLDAMVLIHLSKLNLIDACYRLYDTSHITEKVLSETIVEDKKDIFPEIIIIQKELKEGKIKVHNVDGKKLAWTTQFAIYDGEAESVLLAKEKGFILATDDNNVRNKMQLLEIKLIGTPRIIMDLLLSKKITKEKAKEAVIFLKKEGWFNQVIIDKMLEVIGHV
ncbi:MAG TPA: hypothetical protein VJH24_02990 [Candidatus Bilamarchaeaceae archaeon]|nr:hypothetical protein [Candidatus Bilamarchaeaceae archaeon]